MAALLLTD